MKIAVIGGGWAGLAAAVRATEAGHAVTLFETAAQLGGRARTVAAKGDLLDNGQHILIGAYRRTLALMATVGCDAAAVLDRRPLELRYPDGRGLRMPGGPAWLGFAWAVATCRGWRTPDRLSLLAGAGRWALGRFRCPPTTTVDTLCQALTPAVRQLLVDPLCVAALNTPARQASGQVFLRVLADAIFSGSGSADLLLPRRPLGELLPAPSQAWLEQRGAAIRLGSRVQQLAKGAADWRVDDEAFDRVVLACSAAEAARLAQDHAPQWAAVAGNLRYEPIVTVYLRCEGARLPAPMTALVEGSEAPAQFAFDHGALGATPGRFAFVISGASAWLARGQAALVEAVLGQARLALRPAGQNPDPQQVQVLAEKRATFACTPGLARPPARLDRGLFAAGDYIEGPYPATLEGAVRSGEFAIQLAMDTA